MKNNNTQSNYDIVANGIIKSIEDYSMEYDREIQKRYPDLDFQKVLKASLRACALRWMKNNYGSQDKYFKLMLFACYNELFANMFKQMASVGSFCAHLLYPLLRGEDIVNLALDRRWVEKTQPRRSPFQMALLREQYRAGAGQKKALKALLKACSFVGEKPMSRTNVQIIFREFKRAGVSKKQLSNKAFS